MITKTSFDQNVKLRVLSVDQIQRIHSAAMTILERTGVLVENAEAQKMLRNAGASIVDPNRVKLPSSMVDRAIASAPKKIAIGNRDGDLVLNLESHNSLWGQKIDSFQCVDPSTGTIRDMKRKDNIDAIIVADYLPNIDYIHFGGIMANLPQGLNASIELFKEIIQRSRKPIHFCAESADVASKIIDIAALVRGGYDRLENNPFIMCYNEPITPLKHPDESVKKLFLCAERGIPMIYSDMLMGGATAPATFAGMLALSVAEGLSGLVISQLRREGAPFIFGGMPSAFDMSTAVFPFGAPELHLLCSALTDIAHHYELPMFGTAGVSDAIIPDEQSGIEVMLSCLMTVLSGANVVHDIGLHAVDTAVSLEISVMTDEILEMLRHLIQGVEITEETLALDLIDKIGPSGNYLGEDNTLKYYKTRFFPKFLNRKQTEVWKQEGSKSIRDKVREEVIHILETHVPTRPLSKAILENIQKLEQTW